MAAGIDHSLGLKSDGTIVAERYAQGFDAGTPQLGWSMSKSVTSLLLGRLVQQGLVSLSDDHLRPEWTDERASITIEDLLRMRSGLEDGALVIGQDRQPRL